MLQQRRRRRPDLFLLDSPLSILVLSGMVLAALARVQVASAHHPATQPQSASSSSSLNTASGPATNTQYPLQLMDNESSRGESSKPHGGDGNHDDGNDTGIQSQVAQAAADSLSRGAPAE